MEIIIASIILSASVIGSALLVAATVWGSAKDIVEALEPIPEDGDEGGGEWEEIPIIPRRDKAKGEQQVFH